MNIKAFLCCIIELIVIVILAALIGIAFRGIYNGFSVFGVAFSVLLFIYYFVLSLMEEGSLPKKVFYMFTFGYIEFFDRFSGDVVVGVAIAGFVIGYVYVMFGIGLILAMLISPITYNIQRFKKGI